MNSLETYLQSLYVIRSSGSAVKETSYYGTLENLLNEVGKTLKPRVRCIINIQNQGAGLPDGGLYSAEQSPQSSCSNPPSTRIIKQSRTRPISGLRVNQS